MTLSNIKNIVNWTQQINHINKTRLTADIELSCIWLLPVRKSVILLWWVKSHLMVTLCSSFESRRSNGPPLFSAVPRGDSRRRADWQKDAYSVLIFLISSWIKPPPGMKDSTPWHREMDSEHQNDRWWNYDWGWEEFHINSGSSILLMAQLFSR